MDFFYKDNSDMFRIPIRGENFSSCYMSFISHTPCSYSCEESLNEARKNHNWLMNNEPEIAKRIEGVLKKPFLFFDTFIWISFDGEIRDGILEYSSAYFSSSLLNGEIREKIDKSNKITVNDEEITFYDNDTIIGSYKKDCPQDGFIIDFS